MWLSSKKKTLGFVAPMFKEHLEHRISKTIVDTLIHMNKVKMHMKKKY
jgi:hypothetical protein